MNKQNNSRTGNSTHRSSKHPSDQSSSSQYRPSIKIGYAVIRSETQEKRVKRKVQPVPHIDDFKNCRKKYEESKATISGSFANSEYVKPNETSNLIYHKKGVNQCRDKHQNSDDIKFHLQSQFSSKSRRSCSVASSRNQSILPSYQNTGIKDVIEYHHARPYRNANVTEKCTQSSALSRFCGFKDLHEYDFRKKPQFLR